MALFDLPVRNDVTNYDFDVELDGVVFNLRFYFNSRDEYWYLDLRTEAGAPLILGRRIVVDGPLTKRFRDAGLPAGEIGLVDMRQKAIEATQESFGVDNLLMYLDAAELAAL